MLMRRARAYSSFCSQVVLVCVIHFVAIHASAGENRKKMLQKPYCCGSRSFEVIDVDTTNKSFYQCLL